MTVIDTPRLEGDAAAAVSYRGGHLQIIAAAGSGKTEVVAQRIARLIAEGEPPDSIVALTFNTAAAAELRARADARLVSLVGTDRAFRSGGLSIGTLHAFAFDVLQRADAYYETCDVLDEGRLAAFLAREGYRIGVDQLDRALYRGIGAFILQLDVVESELLDVSSLEHPLRGVIERFREACREFRLLTYGQMISEAVRVLQDPARRGRVTAGLRHLIVDEYQDINPADEQFIRHLTLDGADLCVVGDDDQSIYGWRGADVSNIVTFAERYPDVASFQIVENRRSRPAIVEAAAMFAYSIDGRLDKEMRATRMGTDHRSVLCWSAPDEDAEADWIADGVLEAVRRGYRYADVAVLVRGRAARVALHAAFERHGIPVRAGGRVGLFETPEGQVLGRTLAWLVGEEWKPAARARDREPVDDASLFAAYRQVFALTEDERDFEEVLQRWRDSVGAPAGPADLVGSFYELLSACGVPRWDPDDVVMESRLGTLARCAQVLADFESMRGRARQTAGGGHVGGEDRGLKFYAALASYVRYWGLGNAEGFDGQDDVAGDAVHVGTVHSAKGLEWPIVFVASCTASRFPSFMNGRERDWHIPLDLFDPDRYEGRDADERRLFYVAMTRARELLSISCHAQSGQRATKPSPYLRNVAGSKVASEFALEISPTPNAGGDGQEPIVISFSEIQSYLICPRAFRLRSRLDFPSLRAPELNYGKAVHHILRILAESAQDAGRPPTEAEIAEAVATGFYLPAISDAGHVELMKAAHQLVSDFVADHGDDLRR